MNWYASLRLNVRDWFKRNFQKIIFFIMAFAFVYGLNKYVTTSGIADRRIVTDTSSQVLMSTDKKISQRKQNIYEKKVNEFVGLCNNGKFRESYELLSDDCKEYFSGYQGYKQYITNIFKETKNHALQAYSQVDGRDIYQIKYFSDILSTGLTKDTISYIESKITFVEDKTKEDNIAINVGEYFDTQTANDIYETDTFRIELKRITRMYKTEIYELIFINKTDKTLVIKDGTETREIGINLNGDFRKDIRSTNIVVAPYSEITSNVEVHKFIDDKNVVQDIEFSAIRFIRDYKQFTEAQIIQNQHIGKNIPDEKFSLTMPIRQSK